MTQAANDPGDEVDALVAAWQRERPDLQLEAMQVWSRIHRLALHLDAARRQAYASHELEAWSFDVLAALRRSGRPYRATAGQLSRETHVTSGTMTNRVSRLVESGLVIRESDAVDGRVTWVRLTPVGRQVVDAALIDLLGAERQLLGDISPQSTKALAGSLRRLLSAQETRAEGD